jgi:hypothetical protein
MSANEPWITMSATSGVTKSTSGWSTESASESGPIGNTGPSIANAYTLQLNMNDFASTACSGSADPAVCRGWQQFVFENDGTSALAYIQYWLKFYNKPCPAGMGWNQFSFTGSTDIYCWKNDSLGSPAGIPAQPITNAIWPR